jgi:hypothetical protein
MDRNRILELAIEELERQRGGIDAEIEMVRAELKSAGSAVRKPIPIPAAGTPRRRSRTPAERRAQSERMKQYWAAKRAQAARPPVKAPAPPAAKRRPKSDAEKKALSLKMKEVWKKRKLAVAEKSKSKPAK